MIKSKIRWYIFSIVEIVHAIDASDFEKWKFSYYFTSLLWNKNIGIYLYGFSWKIYQGRPFLTTDGCGTWVTGGQVNETKNFDRYKTGIESSKSGQNWKTWSGCWSNINALFSICIYRLFRKIFRFAHLTTNQNLILKRIKAGGFVIDKFKKFKLTACCWYAAAVFAFATFCYIVQFGNKELTNQRPNIKLTNPEGLLRSLALRQCKGIIYVCVMFIWCLSNGSDSSYF